MNLKLILSLFGALILTGCLSASVPKDQKSAYSGKGQIVSIINTPENYQEVGIKTPKGEHLVVIVKEPAELFPDQKVRVKRSSSGFGTVTAE